jgi:hypothetical protein
MSNVFRDGIQANAFIDRHPMALADVLWALFSGIVLLEESKRIFDDNKDFLKETFDIGFDIFLRGIRKP